VRSVAEQLSDLLLDAPAEARRKSDEKEAEPRSLLRSLNPMTKASSADREAIASNSSKAELEYSPDPSGDRSIRPDAKRPPGSSEHETLKEPAAEERPVKAVSENGEDGTARARDVSSEKSASGENKADADKADASTLDNRAKRKRSYIRPCKRSTGSASPQKPRGKDCGKLPRSESRVNPRAKGQNRKVVGRTEANDGKNHKKNSENGSHKQRNGARGPFGPIST